MKNTGVIKLSWELLRVLGSWYEYKGISKYNLLNAYQIIEFEHYGIDKLCLDFIDMFTTSDCVIF